MLNLMTSLICCVWLSSPVGCINVLISFTTRRSIKMLSWKEARNIKSITDNRKIVIRIVASVWKKESLNLHKNWILCVQLANALMRLCNGRQRTLYWATLLLGSYAGQEVLKLERRKGISIGVDILLKHGRHLAMKISNDR